MSITRLFAFLCLSLLVPAFRAHGETLPAFDLDRETMKSSFILEGTLSADGNFEASIVHKGALRLPAKLRLSYGGDHFSRFAKIPGNDPPQAWVAFAGAPKSDGAYPLVTDAAGIVMISKGDKVYVQWSSWGRGGAGLAPHPTWTAASFSSALQQAVHRTELLRAKLAMHRNAERTRQLVSFMEKEAGLPPENDVERDPFGEGRGYLFYEIAGGLTGPNAEEEAVLTELIRVAASDEQSSLLLALVAAIRPSRTMFKDVLPWVELSAPKLTRREAIRALLACDPYEGAGVLARFLVIDDPHLKTLVSSLASGGWPREATVHHLSVIGPLNQLGKQVLEQSKSRSNDATNLAYAVLSLIQSYIHPDLLPLLVEWSDTPAASTSAQANGNLKSVLCLSNEPMTDPEVRDWWAENKDLFRRPFDLSQPTDLDAWLKEWWSSKNPVTQKVMFYHWDFQPGIPEAELLARCGGPDGEAAKHALSELWQRKRLSPSIHKEIVRRFVKMKIVMDPSAYNPNPAPGELRIESEMRFPFPEGAWFSCTGDVAANREPRIDPGGGGSWNYYRPGRMSFYSSSGTGALSVKGIVEVMEKDYQASPPKELWRLRWKLAQTYREPEVEFEAEPE